MPHRAAFQSKRVSRAACNAGLGLGLGRFGRVKRAAHFQIPHIAAIYSDGISMKVDDTF